MPSSALAPFLDRLGLQLRADLGRNLIGLYVYGSLTQDAFETRRSDVDCVAVIRRPLSAVVTSRLQMSLRRLLRSHPLARRLQLTILIQRELLRFNGDGWLYQFGHLSRTGSDGNPIIWVNILESGLVVLGPPPRTFVPRITPTMLRAALQREIEYLGAELVSARNSVWRHRDSYRRYAALTACRILYTLRTGRVVSKQVAAAWALTRLPTSHRAIVRRASDRPVKGRRLPLEPLRDLVAFVEQRVATSPINQRAAGARVRSMIRGR